MYIICSVPGIVIKICGLGSRVSDPDPDPDPHGSALI
jgi:hypothetical protein